VRRIARGSGSTQQDVQRLIKQFNEMQKMMKQVGKGGTPRVPFNIR
jgi:signal recognition particle subunit SRP54